NELSLSRRNVLLKGEVLAMAVGAAACALALLLARWRRLPLASVERVLWFLSPLALIASLPVLFRFGPWKDRYELLLCSLLAFAVVAELTLARSFASIPAWLSRAWNRARDAQPA